VMLSGAKDWIGLEKSRGPILKASEKQLMT
jgi:hypothetical protein